MVAPDAALVEALTPEVERLLNRHLDTTKEWFPHKLVPWDRVAGHDPAADWDPEQMTLSPGVRSSLYVNLLTEDNLPYYFHTIDALFGADEAWGVWARRWTAEEGRHSIVIRDYLTVSGAIDPVELERARMHQVSNGVVPRPDLAMEGVAYVALQELATRIAHRNTGKALNDPAGLDVMARVAADENLHFLFYRDLMAAAIAADPSASVCAIESQVRNFEMPGTGIIGFAAHARAIADVGIYDLSIHHDQVLVPVVLTQWKIDKLEGLSPEAEVAREQLLKRMARIDKAGRRMASRQAERMANAEDPELAAAGHASAQ